MTRRDLTSGGPASGFRRSGWKDPSVLLAAAVWLIWAVAMTIGRRWDLFEANWFMSLTMVVGSFVAGASSQGGGAVAFPAMTLIFKVDPQVARDFSLMIQSVGMTSAAALILWRRIPVERLSIFCATAGGAVGVVVGIHWVAPLLEPASAKLFFVSLWLAFGTALWRVNRMRDRVLHDELMHRGGAARAVLIGAGFVGGIVSGITGSGLDMLVFSVLVLGFRVCERIATPTSVVLMAGNTVVGFGCRLLAPGGVGEISAEAWAYWWVCVPVVVVGAPLGARFIAGRTRAFVVRSLIFLISVQFITALLVVPLTGELIGLGLTTLLVGILTFHLIWRVGRRVVR